MSESVKVLNEYAGRHHYFEDYTSHAEMHCPNCGRRGSVWIATNGDYYQGPEHICIMCNFGFTMPLSGLLTDSREVKIIEQLRKRETHEPTTPRGN